MNKEEHSKNNKSEGEHKILLVLGAGASKSMESKNKDGFIFNINTGHKEMPLGDGLVRKIFKYNTKSLAWILASTIYQIKSLEFQKDDESFVSFCGFVERHFPENFSLRRYYLDHEQEGILKALDMFSIFFDKKILQENYQCNRITNFNNSLSNQSIDVEKQSKIGSLFCENQFLIEKYKQRLDKNNTDQFETLIFFEFLVGFLAKCDVPIFNHSKISQDLFFKSLHKNIKLICSNIIEINNQINYLRPIRLSGNQLSAHSIYAEYSDAFDRKIKVLENHFDGLSKMSLDLETRLNLIIKKAQELINKYEEFARNKTEMHKDSLGEEFLTQNWTMNIYELNGLFGISFSKTGERVILERPLPKRLSLFISKLEQVKIIDDESIKIDEIIAILESDGFLMEELNKFENWETFQELNTSYTENVGVNFAFLIVEITRLIKAIQNTIIKNNDLNISPFSNSTHLTHLKQTFLVSKIVQEYNPPSIDYFMTNLEFFAPYEFWNKKDNAYCEMDESSKKERKELIHKYTKFIIANILIDCSTDAYYGTDPHGNDYINKIIWKINEMAKFYDQKPELFIKNNLKIITFNYEWLFENQLFNRLSKKVAHSMNRENIRSVYGKIFLEIVDDKNPVTMTTQDALWKAIFFSEGNKYFVKAPEGNLKGNKYFVCENIFGQIAKNMKWIGEGEDDTKEDKKKKEDDRKEMMGFFKEARDVYFLGFGFDFNNLCEMGLIKKDREPEAEAISGKKKFYISGGNAKIINTIKTIFDCKKQKVITTSRLAREEYLPKDKNLEQPENEKIPIQLTNHLYRMESGNIEFIISDKFLPEAIDNF